MFKNDEIANERGGGAKPGSGKIDDGKNKGARILARVEKIGKIKLENTI